MAKVWDKDQEKEHKRTIQTLFDTKIDSALKGINDPLEVGDNLAKILKSSDEDVVKLIVPRAVRKWADRKTLQKWEDLIKDPKMVSELRVIGKSIANSMRPLAGNTFSFWVAKVLNKYFRESNIPLEAITHGDIKKQLSKALVIQPKDEKGIRDYKPDIDIILVRSDQNNKPVAIISAKTTLAERVMQTISWLRYLKTAPVPKHFKELKIFLVTAWETFESGTNKERVQELDGVYVCNKKVKEYGNIKLFSKIAKDLEKLCR